MSRPGGYQGYGAVREYRDDPNYQQYEDNLGTSYDEEFSQITKSISDINTGASIIEKAAKVIGTDRDNGQAGDKIHHVSQDTNKVVKDTMRLMRTLGSKRLDRKQKLQLDKTKNDFQDSVQRFQSLQKRAAEKVKTAQRMEKPKPKPQSAGWLDDDNDEAGLVVDDQRRQHLMAQEQVIDDDLGLIQEREDRIRELESDILDVNEIFRDLGAMVYDQGERIDTIEANVETAYTDVEAGTEQLQKASTYQKKARKKMCCLVVILLIVAAVITLIVVLSVKT